MPLTVPQLLPPLSFAQVKEARGDSQNKHLLAELFMQNYDEYKVLHQRLSHQEIRSAAEVKELETTHNVLLHYLKGIGITEKETRFSSSQGPSRLRPLKSNAFRSDEGYQASNETLPLTGSTVYDSTQNTSEGEAESYPAKRRKLTSTFEESTSKKLFPSPTLHMTRARSSPSAQDFKGLVVPSSAQSPKVPFIAPNAANVEGFQANAMEGRTLFVRNLSPKVTEAALTEFFKSKGYFV
jgi:hypothetical protein